MPVVSVAHMRMGVLKLLVAMLMGMPEGAIRGMPSQILGGVGMLVMGVAVAGIVAMAMGMAQSIVAMPMAVLFPQQQHHPRAHQRGG